MLSVSGGVRFTTLHRGSMSAKLPWFVVPLVVAGVVCLVYWMQHPEMQVFLRTWPVMLALFVLSFVTIPYVGKRGCNGIRN